MTDVTATQAKGNGMTDDPDVGILLRNAHAKLGAAIPLAKELDDMDTARAVRKVELTHVEARLVTARAELNNAVGERDRALAEIAQTRKELLLAQNDLAQLQKQHETLDRQVNKMKGKL
jgi:uncharacterized protein (DUF3084 family)